jgi:hypothetical protein
MNADYDDSSATRQRLYEQTKAEVISKQLANSTTYDTSILTLSSALLALSVGFIKDVVAPISSATILPALYLSWVSFGLAIISTVSSFMIGQWGYKALLKGAERYYIKGEPDAFNVSVTVSRRIEIANYIHGAMFVVGTIFMLVFVIANFSRLANMPDPNAPKSPLVERGQPTNAFPQIPTKPILPPSVPQPSPAPTSAPPDSKQGT